MASSNAPAAIAIAVTGNPASPPEETPDGSIVPDELTSLVTYSVSPAKEAVMATEAWEVILGAV